MPATRPSTSSGPTLPRQPLHSSRSAAIGDALMSTYNRVRDKTSSSPLAARPRTGVLASPSQSTPRRHAHNRQATSTSTSTFATPYASSSVSASTAPRSPWNLHDMSSALPSWPEKPLTARRRPREAVRGEAEEDGGEQEEEDDYSESVSEVERKSGNVGADGEAEDYDMRPFVSSSMLPSPAASRPYSPISSSSSRPVSRLSSRSSVHSSTRPSPHSSLPTSKRSSLSFPSSSTPTHLRSTSRLRDLPEFECGRYVNSGRLAAECGHYPNLHNLLQLQREREATQQQQADSSQRRHMRYSSASVSASPSMLSSMEHSSDEEAEEAEAEAEGEEEERRAGSSVMEEESGDESDELHPPIVLGNFFSRQPVSSAAEESKVAVEFDGGSERECHDSGSEEGRSRPVSSRGSRRSER